MRSIIQRPQPDLTMDAHPHIARPFGIVSSGIARDRLGSFGSRTPWATRAIVAPSARPGNDTFTDPSCVCGSSAVWVVARTRQIGSQKQTFIS